LQKKSFAKGLQTKSFVKSIPPFGGVEIFVQKDSPIFRHFSILKFVIKITILDPVIVPYVKIGTSAGIPDGQ
jgi:hypothetical protein